MGPRIQATTTLASRVDASSTRSKNSARTEVTQVNIRTSFLGRDIGRDEEPPISSSTEKCCNPCPLALGRGPWRPRMDAPAARSPPDSTRFAKGECRRIPWPTLRTAVCSELRNQEAYRDEIPPSLTSFFYGWRGNKLRGGKMVHMPWGSSLAAGMLGESTEASGGREGRAAMSPWRRCPGRRRRWSNWRIMTGGRPPAWARARGSRRGAGRPRGR